MGRVSEAAWEVAATLSTAVTSGSRRESAPRAKATEAPSVHASEQGDVGGELYFGGS